jgi:hypothetical protein
MLIGLTLNAEAIITSDGNGTHIAQPGTPMFGINHDGVARLIAQMSTGGSALCSGTLLEGGRHVLTAAHCVDNADIQSISVRFELPAGNVTIPATSWTPHPLGRSVRDVGIITLSQRAPLEIPRTSPLRSVGMDLNVPNYTFGYGLKGYGATGRDTNDGNKRGGRNTYEATGTTKRVTNLTLGGDDTHHWLFSDFDNGLAANDGFGFHFGQSGLGYGDDEVYATSGDSGGPILVPNGHTFVIAGVVSSGGRYENGPTNPNSDVDATINGTWGQFSVDARISEAQSLSFIESFIAPELEQVSGTIRSEVSGMVLETDASTNEIVYVRFTPSLTNSVWSAFMQAQPSTNGSFSIPIDPAAVSNAPAGFFTLFKETE